MMSANPSLALVACLVGITGSERNRKEILRMPVRSPLNGTTPKIVNSRRRTKTTSD